MNKRVEEGNERYKATEVKKQKNVGNWEMYHDPAYYDMWAVRDINDKSFNSPRLFHFVTEEEAYTFLHLIRGSL